MRSTLVDFAPRFLRLMTVTGLTQAQAAELCCVSPHTVIAWMKPAEWSSHNRCPEWAVELLRLKIEERQRNANLPVETAAWMSES